MYSMRSMSDVLYSILECQYYCIESSTVLLRFIVLLCRGKYVMLAVATSDRDIIETAVQSKLVLLWALNSVFLCVVFYSRRSNFTGTF